MTREATVKLTRAQILDEAKKLVLHHGPSNVLEFGIEYVRDEASVHRWSEEDITAVDVEAMKQAHRVYAFLGYVRT
jgi:hypothetical protein